MYQIIFQASTTMKFYLYMPKGMDFLVSRGNLCEVHMFDKKNNEFTVRFFFYHDGI